MKELKSGDAVICKKDYIHKIFWKMFLQGKYYKILSSIQSDDKKNLFYYLESESWLKTNLSLSYLEEFFSKK